MVLKARIIAFAVTALVLFGGLYFLSVRLNADTSLLLGYILLILLASFVISRILHRIENRTNNRQ
jgi:hypothetical protein